MWQQISRPSSRVDPTAARALKLAEHGAASCHWTGRSAQVKLEPSDGGGGGSRTQEMRIWERMADADRLMVAASGERGGGGMDGHGRRSVGNGRGCMKTRPANSFDSAH